MLLGRLAKPDSHSTERTSRKEYHRRLPERDVTARLNVERMQRKKNEGGMDVKVVMSAVAGLPNVDANRQHKA